MPPQGFNGQRNSFGAYILTGLDADDIRPNHRIQTHYGAHTSDFTTSSRVPVAPTSPS